MITKNFTTYGLAVVVAFAAAVVLLIATAPLGASADKGVTAGGATTITNAAGGTAVTISGTHVSGKEACDEGTFAVSTPVGGTAAAAVNAACTTITTTSTVLGTTTKTSLTVTSTTGFPAAGSIVIDGDGDNNLGTGAATIEIFDYTSKTATSFDGLTLAAGSSNLATAVGADIWPAVYSQVAINPLAATNTTVNVADASGFVAGGGVGADLLFTGGTAEVVAASLRSGNTFTTAALAQAHALGTYVIQISGVNTDTATSLFTRTASTTTEGSFKFTLTANAQVSTAGTQSLTIIADKPVVNDTEATVSATTPTALPVLVQLSGSDSTEVAAGTAFTLTVLPTKGILGTITTPLCVNVALAKVGEVMTNCTSQVLYTPLLGATGTDSFSYTMTNGAEVSSAGTGSIILPAAAPAAPVPTPAAGFAGDLSSGVNLTTYGGGTVEQLGTDAADAGATSVVVTVEGAFIVYVVGAPAFVNQAFTDQYPDGVPADTVVLVLAS